MFLGGYRGEDDDDYYDGRRDGSRGEGSRAESSRGDSSRGEGGRGEGGRGEGGRGEGSRGEGGRGEGGRGESSRGDSGSEGTKDGKPTLRVSGPASGTVYDKPRVPPKVRRPVPINERDKYDYSKKTTDGNQSPPQDHKKTSKPPTKAEDDDDEYYDEEYEDDYVKPLPPKRGKGGSEYSSEAASKTESRRPTSRQRPRQSSRRRPDRYDDDYEEDRPVRPRKRNRYEDPPQMSRGNRGGNRGYTRDEPDPVPSERPGFISNSRYPAGNRKKAEDERSVTSKRPPSRVVYDEDEEEEEYYDDEEDDAQDDDSSKRTHKPPSHSASSERRRNEDYEADSGRKYNTPSRKPIGDTKSNVRSDSRVQNSGGYQGEMTRNENGKTASRLKFEATSSKLGSKSETCKNGCDDDYSDYSVDDTRPEKNRGSERDEFKQTSVKDSQRQMSERDRLFSSRFRDSVSDSKSKQQSQDQTGPGKVSSSLTNLRTTTLLNPNPSQRTKNGRIKPAIEETANLPRSTTTTESFADYSDESSTSGSKYSNFRSKGRVVPPTPLINNYKTYSTTEEPLQQDDNEDNNSNQNLELEASSTEDPVSSSSDKTIISPRPFGGLMRRPTKATTEPASFDEFSVSPKIPSMNVNYRQPTKVNEDDERAVRKPTNPVQSFRRIKTEPPQVENSDYSQQKTPYGSNSFRRPVKPVEEYDPEDIPQTGVQDEAQTSDDNFKMSVQPSFSDKPQMSNSNYGGAYRRVKVSTNPTPTTEYEGSTPSYETPQTYQGAPLSNPVNSYKRPYSGGRPLSNYPVVVEETTKNTLSQNNPYMRRPVKQRFQDSEASSGVQDYNPTSTSSGTGESYIKVEQGLGINLRPSLQYFPPKRGKLRIDDSSARGLEQYSKQININQDDQFSKQSPKLDITAPGPSAPEADVATVKSTHYNNAPPGFPLDIPEEEYDVTLNDALQPSTLHPTRSLVDYQQSRLKTRDYQSNIGRSPEYVSRGRVAYLLPAASQQYITRVQSAYSPEKQEENPVTARYTDHSKGDNKVTSLDQQEYEAVVLTAPNDQWPNQRRNRPTEWYW